MYAAPSSPQHLWALAPLRFLTCVALRLAADGNNKGMWLGMLDPGNYTFKVRYRCKANTLSFSSGSDWNVWKLEVVQL